MKYVVILISLCLLLPPPAVAAEKERMYLQEKFLREGSIFYRLEGALYPTNEELDKGADAYENGDYATAVHQWRPLAENGFAVAQDFLGHMYHNGYGVPQNYAQAMKWYRKAAERGPVSAQFSLGFMYENEQGVPQDYVRAVEWYRKAAERGVASAQTRLGFMYGLGRGVPQDFVLAHMWLILAAGQGNETSPNVYSGVMTSAQTKEAELLANRWRAQHPAPQFSLRLIA
jgi:TPR repeat protein